MSIFSDAINAVEPPKKPGSKCSVGQILVLLREEGSTAEAQEIEEHLALPWRACGHKTIAAALNYMAAKRQEAKGLKEPEWHCVSGPIGRHRRKDCRCHE
jgi:hypothetical protein